MIQPNEIRIGNYVNVIDKIDKVTGISIRLRPDCGYYSFKNFHAELKGIHVKPIPLTEDILLICGFERFEFDNGQPNQYRLKNRLIVIRDNIFIDYGSNVKIYSLHQLQNLIHALTNEELTINL